MEYPDGGIEFSSQEINGELQQIIQQDEGFLNDNIYFPELFPNVEVCVVPEPTAEFPIEVASSTGTLPCTEDYPGPFNFELMLDSQTASKKSWIYSQHLKKVFIDVHKSVMIQFKLNFGSKIGLRVRVLPVYTQNDYASVAVIRCLVHIRADDPYSNSHSPNDECHCPQWNQAQHIVRAEHPGAMYCYNKESQRHSVLVPVDMPQAGTDSVSVAYHFVCKTSCVTGMNRRPIKLIFTLETHRGEVVGRQCLPIKICSCPRRDCERDESYMHEKKMESEFGHRAPTQPSPMKPKPLKKQQDPISAKRIKLETLADGSLERSVSISEMNEKLNRMKSNLQEIQGQMQVAVQGFQNEIQKMMNVMANFKYHFESNFN